VLEEVRDPDDVEVVRRQLDVHDVADDRLDAGLRPTFLVGDEVDRPALLRRDRVQELAATRSRVQHALGPAEALVDEGPDLAPDGRPGALVDVAEAVVVEALVVQAAER
jgi:hypothetical protein